MRTLTSIEPTPDELSPHLERRLHKVILGIGAGTLDFEKCNSGTRRQVRVISYLEKGTTLRIRNFGNRGGTYTEFGMTESQVSGRLSKTMSGVRRCLYRVKAKRVHDLQLRKALVWDKEQMNHGPNEEDLFERGVELFNGGEYFLAHEAWEDWWRASSHPQKQTNQGIVQIAVAMHHVSKGNFSGARSVMERALRNLERAPDDYQGLDFVRLRADMQSVLQQLDSREAIRPFRISRK